MAIYNEMVGSHMALATGDNAGAGSGLTAWINAKAAYIAGELIPCDIPLGWDIEEPTYNTARSGSMSTSRVSNRYSTGRREGVWKSKHAFQTCQFIYWLMQTAGTPTTEGTPVGYNTHALTVGTVNTPLWHGIHFERESIASNELRYDMMGLLPSQLSIECGPGKDLFDATQEITVPFAYVKTDASDITAQTERPFNVVGTKWKTWDNLITGNGAGKSANLTGLLYNSTSLEVDVLRVKINLSRTYKFGAPDNTDYWTTGLIGDFEYTVELDVHPVGDALYTLNRLKKESYAGDLDFAFSFTADATNDKISFTFDKMYLVPFRQINDYKQNIEGYTITLEPFDHTSSLTVTGIDGLDNTHFENP
jgi:hypothetical protein